MDWAYVHKSWDKWASTNIGSDLVTSIHENWIGARCINTSKPVGEGAIVMQTAVYILVAIYEGSISPASRVMSAADQLT